MKHKHDKSDYKEFWLDVAAGAPSGVISGAIIQGIGWILKQS